MSINVYSNHVGFFFFFFFKDDDFRITFVVIILLFVYMKYISLQVVDDKCICGRNFVTIDDKMW